MTPEQAKIFVGVVEAFIAFEKGTASCPEEDEELAKLDYDG